MSKYLLREYYELCEGGVCQDLLTEDEKRLVRENKAVFLTGVWWDGNDVMGKVQVLNTPSGQVLKSLVESGVKLGISSRGLGSVHESQGRTIVEDDFQLICFDFVSEPSTQGAFMMTEGKNINLDAVFTKADRINRALNEVLREKE